MKATKKILIGLGGLLALTLILAIAIPIFFKDDICAAVKREVDAKVNADVQFDADDFHLSLFRHFPHITAGIEKLSVFNREPFKGHLLFSLGRLDIEVNLFDVIFDHQMKVRAITLEEPQVHIKVLKDGTANYDIMVPSADTVQTEVEGPFSFSFQIDRWEIVDGRVSYDDASIPFALALYRLNHAGKGDFNEKMFDLETHTSSDTLSIAYGGVEYLSNKKLNVDLTLAVSEAYSRYAFKQSNVSLNDFALGFDGWFKMNKGSYDMDITYQAKESAFKTLLSLIPGIYTKRFSDIEAAGNVAFGGAVKGNYSETRLPAFSLTTKVTDGMFKYPDLPAAVKNVNMDLLVDNKDGVIDNTRIDLKKLHFDFGANPFDLRLIVENLRNYSMDGALKARLLLEDVSKIVPMEGLAMRGNLSVDAKAKGVYDSVRKTIPTIAAAMTLQDGYVKSSAFPLPLENLSFSSTVKNVSGKMAETRVEVQNLSLMLDGEKLTAHAAVGNLDDYTWDIDATGAIDLEKMTKIFPIDSMQLAGHIDANVKTKGKMSDLDKRRYDRMPTSGRLSLAQFRFKGQGLPYNVSIDKADMTFDPKEIHLTNLDGKVGRSDFQASGSLSNYIAYILSDNEPINATVSINSNLLDLNEFMTSSSSEPESSAATSDSLSVIPVPKNINALLNANVKTLEIMDYKITNASGGVSVKDETATLKNLKFELLSGLFRMDGAYNTRDLSAPLYDMKFNVADMDIAKAFEAFSIVKQYAPIARQAKGKFNADLSLDGKLLANMSPDLKTVNGKGVIQVQHMGIAESKIISALTKLTKLPAADGVTLKDTQLAISIDNGRLSVSPFSVNVGDYKTGISGSVGLDGSLDYTLNLKAPVDKLGKEVTGFVQQNLGGAITEIPLTIGVGGTYAKPKLALKSTAEQKQQIKEAAAAVIKEKGKEALRNAVQSEDAKNIVDNILKLPSGKAGSIDSANQKKPAEQLIEQGLKNLFKKKKQ